MSWLLYKLVEVSWSKSKQKQIENMMINDALFDSCNLKRLNSQHHDWMV